MGLPVDESSIWKAEREGSFTFPVQWKQALMRSNGFDLRAGGDNWRAFPVKDTRSKKQLARSCNHVLQETSVFQSFPFFPDNAIAIASNDAGDALVVQKGSNDVLIWCHETGTLSITILDYSAVQ